ncbi:DUF4272 domain-containing protein [Caulobacter endophyticus]|uniref:DUF4272 domain-containing protein n=1 Tax=Caulobacter endophyticus TaxID=2172652 RepID=UPI00240F6276|nr:DUF4272 domain-containing protein [Caulobacter endophyticus]MDG2531627.1 DUF4272 domain-containing protein [Caulobacter endophyticus]
MADEFSPDVIRSPEEVARRALALFSVVGVALGAPRSDVLDWLKETGVSADLSPSEDRFLATSTPPRQQLIDSGWLSERLAVLCWALGEVSELPPSDQQYDPAVFQDLLPPFADVDTASFIANAKLRSDEALITKADELLGHHWEARNAKLTGMAPAIPVDIEIVQERHHAINWVIGYDGAAWDEVTTDT